MRKNSNNKIDMLKKKKGKKGWKNVLKSFWFEKKEEKVKCEINDRLMGKEKKKEEEEETEREWQAKKENKYQ